MKYLITILLISITVSSYSQGGISTIKVQGVDTAAMLLPYKRNYPRQAVSLTFTTTGTSGAATGTYSNSTGVFTINVPQYLAPTNGQFTSAAVGTTNITSTTSSPIIYWTNINGQVHGSISGNLTPTSTGATQVSFTLPSATSLTAGVIMGSGSVAENGGTAIAPAFLYVSNSTNVTIKFIATIAAAGSYYLSFDYKE